MRIPFHCIQVANNGPIEDIFVAPLLKNHRLEGRHPNLIAHLDEYSDQDYIDNELSHAQSSNSPVRIKSVLHSNEIPVKLPSCISEHFLLKYIYARLGLLVNTFC